jgi:GNAT superfamily N-acetyltransferase
LDDEDYYSELDEKLAWKGYPSFDDIIIDETSTLFINLGCDASQEAFTHLQSWAAKNYPQSKLLKGEYDNDSFRIINKSDVAISFCVNNCLVVRFLNPDLKTELYNYLEKTYSLGSESFVEIKHIEEKFSIWNSKMKVISRTGVIKDEKDWLPYSFWKIYKGKNFISRALIGFRALEMSECAPTILMFDVMPKFRRKGFGREIVTGIEYYMCENGCTKLRLENTKAILFWQKLGYDIDIDEGEKYLDWFDFEKIFKINTKVMIFEFEYKAKISCHWHIINSMGLCLVYLHFIEDAGAHLSSLIFLPIPFYFGGKYLYKAWKNEKIENIIDKKKRMIGIGILVLLLFIALTLQSKL